MERINTLSRNQILKELQSYKKYHNHTQKEISTEIGTISDLRTELYKLEKRKIKHENEEKCDEIKNVKGDKNKSEETKNVKNHKTKTKSEKEIHLLFVQSREDYPDWENADILAAPTNDALMFKFIKYMTNVEDDEWNGHFNDKKEYISFLETEFQKLEVDGVISPEFDKAYLIKYKMTTM